MPCPYEFVVGDRYICPLQDDKLNLDLVGTQVNRVPTGLGDAYMRPLRGVTVISVTAIPKVAHGANMDSRLQI